MSRQIICDRCGSQDATMAGFLDTEVDLCTNCVASLKLWMDRTADTINDKERPPVSRRVDIQ